MQQLTLQIDGMSCAHCVARVKNALSATPGVDVQDVEIGSARLTFNPDVTSPDRIAAAVTDAGYDARPSATAA